MLSLNKSTGSIKPKPHTGGRKATINEDMLLQIKALVTETPDITLQGIKDTLGLSISLSIICDTVNKKLNLRHKKTLFATGQNNEEVLEARENWANDQVKMDSASIYFLMKAASILG